MPNREQYSAILINSREKLISIFIKEEMHLS